MLFTCALILLFGLLFVLTRSVISRQFEEAEIHQVKLELDRIRRFVEMETAHMQTIAMDWASWKDVQTFVEGRNLQFPPADLSPSAINNLGVDFLAIWDRNGKLLAFRRTAAMADPTPSQEELLATIESEDTFGTSLTTSSRGGVITSGNQLVVLGSAPVPSSGNGKGSSGSILAGRFLNANRLQSLQPVGAGTVNFLPLVTALENPSMREDITALLASGGPVIRPLNDKVTWGAVLLRDIGEYPITGLVIEQGRDLYAAGQRAVRIFLLAMTAAGGALTLLLWVILDFTLLRRIARLDRGVRKLRIHGKIPPELSAGWRDELGTLSVSITELTTSLQEAEAGYRRLFETSQDGTLVLSASKFMIHDANPSFCQLMGMQHRDLIGVHLGAAIPRFPVEDLAQCLAHKMPYHKEELHLRRVNGPPFYVEIVGVPFEGTDGLQVQLSFRDITERKRSEQTLRELSGRLLRLQDEERRRIARELHDSTAQNLSALEINFTLLEKWAAGCDAKIQNIVSQSREIAVSCSREIRTLSYLLHPPLLDEVGLLFAIRWFIEGYSSRTGIQVRLDLPEEFPRLPSEVETALFRVIQECLTNVYRHSESKEAWVCLSIRADSVSLEIGDKGLGFTMGNERKEPHSGLGLPGMRERIRQQGGEFSISPANPGTVIRASIPHATNQLTLEL